MFPNDDSLEDVLDAVCLDENGEEIFDDDGIDTELESDLILERQEMEDFEQTDEYFGYYGDDCDY